MSTRLIKGYANDAGVDVELDHSVEFKPHSTTVVPLGINYVCQKNECGIICARTSAAKKGLIIANCPVDPDYKGDWHAIVHNVSDEHIIYPAGTAFCQIVFYRFNSAPAEIKKQGKRTVSAFGKTDIKEE